MKTFWGRIKKLKKKQIVWGIVIVVVAFIGFKIFGGNANDTTGTLTVQRGDFVKEVSVSGKVVAAESVDLSFAESGRVTNVNVDVGTQVVQGQTLASLVTGTLLSQLQSARATLAEREAESASSETSLEKVQREQDTLVENAYQKLLSNDLAAVPSSNSNTATPPVISGLYKGAEGRYKFIVKKTNSGLSGREIRVFELENVNDVKVLQNEATPLGTRGLFVSFPDNLTEYDETTWYVTIPNTRSATYVTAYQNYQEAIRTRDRAVETARARLTAGSSGISAAQAGIESARAEVTRIQAEIAERTISAPFTGVVTKVDAKVGEVSTANTPAISMISADKLQIESFIPEINLPFIKIGDVAVVTLDAYGDEIPFEARVVFIDPAETIRDGVSTYRAKLEFTTQDERIRSGMTANVIITSEKKSNVIVVPQKAVTSKNGKKYVIVRVAEQNTEREVTTGSVSSYGEIEITSGLNPGDVVVLPASK
ncbi:MAG TPA: efflux RND transporter periplasmic adaptor subunit [Candidatus Nanoarchaeia archaeon]|nr:efflux RND transporter periplasmic adaptor subunit [Candidatus Nanoarchaeia archaeon]